MVACLGRPRLAVGLLLGGDLSVPPDGDFRPVRKVSSDSDARREPDLANGCGPGPVDAWRQDPVPRPDVEFAP